MPRTFDYSAKRLVAVGARVQVRFAGRSLTGVVVRALDTPSIDPAKVQPVAEVLDEVPIISPWQLSLCRWAARYYHHPLGEVLARAMPKVLRAGGSAQLPTETIWSLLQGVDDGELQTLAKRAKLQYAALEALRTNSPQSEAQLKHFAIKPATLKTLQEKALITCDQRQIAPVNRYVVQRAPQLNDEQQAVVHGVDLAVGQAHLIDGVTGSGKTEVYIRLIQQVVAAGKQALVLVPEIGLTPQLLERIASRVDAPVVTYHSHNSDKVQHHNWLHAMSGKAGVVVGTRSAAFVDMPDLGLIVVDEEHDASFKSQDSVRFNGRDLAVKRAADLKIPIVMGSATPSLESLKGVAENRYRYWQLTKRATSVAQPVLRLVDTTAQPLDGAIALTVKSQALAALNRGEQVMVFLNRRGYAPEMNCKSCGWQADCAYCDAKATVHLARSQLACHHCGHFSPLPSRCPQCNSLHLQYVGAGTERLEYELESVFDGYPVIRVDRDSISTQSKLEANLGKINAGEPCVIVGTQMLAKGHHFAKLSTVIILGTDSALMAADFRAPERLGQLITQVAGRAGRELGNGQVLLQTEMPNHPWLQCLSTLNYQRYAALMQADRQAALLPPYRQMAILRVEGKVAAAAEDLLKHVSQYFLNYWGEQRVQAVGPMLAPMARVADRTRYQLWLFADTRSSLHAGVAPMVEYLHTNRAARALRWSIDIDPQDMS